MKKLNDLALPSALPPMARACTTIGESSPIFSASCSAAPSARLSSGMGRVKLSCTMPSPVLSPYGRMTSPTPATSGARTRRAIGPFQDVAHRVVVVVLVPGDAVETLAAGRRALHDPEGAVRDRVEQRPALDALQELYGLGEHLVGAPLDEAAGRRHEVLVQPGSGPEHVLHVLQRDVPIGQPRRREGVSHHAEEQDALAGHDAVQVE